MPTHPKKQSFKKFLTDNPVQRKKYEIATKVIGAIKKLAKKK